MLIGIKKFLKFLFGFCLAILLSGFIYNYLPDFLKLAKETGFFVASLVNSQNQKEIADPVLKTFHAPDLIETERGPTPLETSQDELDDLADQIDIIRRQINDLIAEKSKIQNPNIKSNPNDKKDEINDKEEKDLKDEVDKEDKQADVDLVEINKNKPNYFQILISEVQIAGQDDDKQEFVELYNPNSEAISLTGWYLQRKTKTAQDFATYVPSNLFAGKIIYPKSYFLIAREGSFFANYADILTNNPLTEDNSLVLKNPNKETSDLLGFGLANWFLQAPAENPTNGKTIGRKWLELEKTEQDTGSNNFDFEIQLSTPKQQNIKYIVPIILPPSSGGGGGSGEIIYDKIIISEVKIAEKTGDKNVFIELYNQNNKEVDLTGWYIFRNNTSFITKTMFEGKKIPSNGYFLISKEESLWQDLSDLQFEGTLNEDDNISLKNPKGDPVDSVGWSKITENLTWGRKDNIGDFELQRPTPKSQNITFVEPPIVEIPKDKTPPEVVFGLLSAIQTNLSFPISFEITDLLGTVTPSGVNSYIFRWNDLDPAAAENWHEDAEQSFSANPVIREFTGEEQKTYYFQVKAKDKESNESLWLPIEPISTKIELPILPIVINEIQIDSIDGDGGVDDDWVKLYNPNETTDVSLVGFSIQKHSKKEEDGQCLITSNFYSKSFSTDAKILAKGYFYVVSTQAKDSLKLLPGMTIGWSLSDNNTIYLVKSENKIESINDSNIINKVGFGSACSFEGMPVPAPPDGGSIKRKNLEQNTNNNFDDFEIIAPVLE